MTAITVSFTNKDSNRIAVGKPITTGLWHDIWDNTQFVKEWLGASYVGGAIQDHSHDGVDSKPITLKYPFWRDFGDGSDGSVTHSTNANIAAGIYNYINFTINSSIVLTQNTRGPLVIRCTGVCTINGSLIGDNMGGLGGFFDTNNVPIHGEGNSYNPNSASKDYAGVRYIPACGGSGGGHDSANHYAGASILTAGGLTGAGATPSAAARLMALAMNMPFWGGAGASVRAAGATVGRGGSAILIIANTIVFASGAVISVKGENGGVGGGTNGNGGGGGGVIVFAYKTLSSDLGTKTVTGGLGGDGSVSDGYAGGDGWTANLQV